MITKKINELAPFLSKDDFNWIIPELIKQYENKFSYLTYVAYGPNAPELAKKAMIAKIEKELEKALETFLLKKEHWRDGRDINAYLLSTINSLAKRTKYDTDSIKKINSHICPGCKSKNKKEYLHEESGKLRCIVCTEQLDSNPNSKLYKSFALHSKRGYSCPECSRFIPKSINSKFGISCPYDDCLFIGSIDDLNLMNHPTSVTSRVDASLQESSLRTPASDSSTTIEYKLSDGKIGADLKLEIMETFISDHKILKDVIDNQIKFIKRNKPNTELQQCLMYEAFRIMSDKYPEDMIQYLVYRKQVSDTPLQSKIFQEYVRLVQDSLPCTIKKGNKDIDIYSLTDKNLSLFLGISEYETYVQANGIIINETKEHYCGSRNFTDYGPCFIGLLLDVTKDKVSVIDKVKEYSFVQIKTDLEPKTKVVVKHYRIPSHYEMMSLVHLQKIRKNIVDKIFYLNNGKHRSSGE